MNAILESQMQLSRYEIIFQTQTEIALFFRKNDEAIPLQGVCRDRDRDRDRDRYSHFALVRNKFRQDQFSFQLAQYPVSRGMDLLAGG